MSSPKKYANEWDIERAQPGTKLNFGGNLYLRVSTQGKKTFHFRMSLNRSDTTRLIGDASDLSLAAAKKIAAERRGEVVRARQKISDSSFPRLLSAKSASSKPKKAGKSGAVQSGSTFIGFRSLEDSGRFLAAMMRNRDSMTLELYCWLRLRLLLPSRSADLLKLRWDDLDAINTIVTFADRRPGRAWDAIPKTKVAYLSDAAFAIFVELRKGGEAEEYIFPQLRRAPTSSRHLSIRQALQRAWPHYHVKPDEFAAFFESAAKSYSFFSDSLVDGLLLHRPGSPSDYNYETYVLQLKALSRWWGETCQWFAHGHSSIRWGGVSVRAEGANGRPKYRNMEDL